jgi:hypothetical protein
LLLPVGPSLRDEVRRPVAGGILDGWMSVRVLFVDFRAQLFLHAQTLVGLIVD